MSLIYKTLLLFLLLNNTRQVFCLSTKPVLNSVFEKKDSVIQRETLIINRNRYTAINILNDTENKFFIEDGSGKIVYTYNGQGILSFKFIDFNNDGYKDIIVELRGVDSGQQDLIIYDTTSKTFKLAGNCSNAEKILKTKYYYTYEDCCMGREWSSDLFYISESKIINIGHIKYSDGYGLCFFKLDGRRKRLLKKQHVRINGDTPVTTGPHIDFDLGHYWTKHWSSFSK